jgi:hypothetical protein
VKPQSKSARYKISLKVGESDFGISQDLWTFDDKTQKLKKVVGSLSTTQELNNAYYGFFGKGEKETLTLTCYLRSGARGRISDRASVTRTIKFSLLLTLTLTLGNGDISFGSLGAAPMIVTVLDPEADREVLSRVINVNVS